jgi:uncharacterized protein (TIGR00369 family)
VGGSREGVSQTAAEFVNAIPATQHFGMEITDASEGEATGRLPVRDELCFARDERPVIHGAATYALADNVGAAAVISLLDAARPAVTIDMRIDYLGPAATDLTATADVRRFGRSVSVVDVEVEDEDGDPVAIARGAYRSR